MPLTLTTGSPRIENFTPVLTDSNITGLIVDVNYGTYDGNKQVTRTQENKDRWGSLTPTQQGQLQAIYNVITAAVIADYGTAPG